MRGHCRLQKIVDEFDRVCKRRKLKVNAGKSKVMVFEREREQTIGFAKPYRVRAESTMKCRIRLREERMEMTEFIIEALSNIVYQVPHIENGGKLH